MSLMTRYENNYIEAIKRICSHKFTMSLTHSLLPHGHSLVFPHTFHQQTKLKKERKQSHEKWTAWRQKNSETCYKHRLG